MKNIFFILFVTSTIVSCQPNLQEEISFKPNKEIQNYVFPEDWLGEWKGVLQIYSGKTVKQEVEMELHILAIDSIDRHTFTIIYGKDKEKGKRPYEVFAVDTVVGHYKVDEKNDIILDEYLFGNKLVSRFEVMGNLLLSTYERTAEGIEFEILSGSMKEIAITGGTSADIPEVKSFPIKVRQFAKLTKK